MNGRTWARNYPDNRHHPAVFMLQDVAVIDKIADVGAAKIHSHGHTRIRSMPTLVLPPAGIAKVG